MFFDRSKNEYFFDRDFDLFFYIIQFYCKGIFYYFEDECVCCFVGEFDFFGIVRNYLSDCCYEVF